MNFFELIPFLVIAGVIFVPRLLKKRSAARSEALFRSMFPDLQPTFHPATLVQYVRTRRQGGKLVGEGAAALEQATYEEQPQGAVLRYGKGKFTVDVNEPRVKYWHPEREFKWQPKRKEPWWFSTPIAERSIDSGDSGTSWSSSDTARTAATGAVAAAPFAAAGGAFDGGGAAQAWDGGGGAGGGGATAY